MSELTADAVTEALARVPQVRLHPGSAAGTHLPGRRVPGVRLRDRAVEVHIAVVYPTTVHQAAEAVRAALAALPVDHVDVMIDDVVLPGEEEPDTPKAPASPEVPHA